jgi:hypothetical protein
LAGVASRDFHGGGVARSAIGSPGWSDAVTVPVVGNGHRLSGRAVLVR